MRRKMTKRNITNLVFLVMLSQLITLGYLALSRYNDILLLKQSFLMISNRDSIVNPGVFDKNCIDYFNLLASFDKYWGFDITKNSELQIQNTLSHLRIYNACFLNGKSNDFTNFKTIDDKLFPFFKRSFPKFEYSDGNLDDTILNHIKIENNQSYWETYQKNIKGKGIVISIGEFNIQDAENLIKSLRFLGNDLKIEFVHGNDVTKTHKIKLQRAATNNLLFNKTFSFNENQQSISFVDISNLVDPKYNKRFKSFSNKWLAGIFNSFEEMILLDSDAVPFIKPEEFFEFESYENTGAYFFKDRELADRMQPNNMIEYRNFLPTTLETNAFNILKVSPDNLTQTNFFEEKSKHLMESGLIVMNRKTHFIGLLASVHLQFWPKTAKPVYGDKELWWLGQLLSGNDKYFFDEVDAGAVGVLNEDLVNHNASVCSIQLAHFKKNGELLWLNGGLKNCKKRSWKKDFDSQEVLRQTYKNPSQLRNHYKKPLVIEAAIIPKAVEKFSKPKMNPIYTSTFIKNEALGCNGYFHCANIYNLSSNGELADSNGKLIRYNQKQIDFYKDLINAWNSRTSRAG